VRNDWRVGNEARWMARENKEKLASGHGETGRDMQQPNM
jgi:hypothetical protein